MPGELSPLVPARAVDVQELQERVAALEEIVFKKRKTRLPTTWVPSDHARDKSMKEYPHLDLRAELQAFRDYHISRGNTMVDWDRAWYTWLRSATRYNRRDGRAVGRRTNDDKIRELMELDVDAQT